MTPKTNSHTKNPTNTHEIRTTTPLQKPLTASPPQNLSPPFPRIPLCDRCSKIEIDDLDDLCRICMIETDIYYEKQLAEKIVKQDKPNRKIEVLEKPKLLDKNELPKIDIRSLYYPTHENDPLTNKQNTENRPIENDLPQLIRPNEIQNFPPPQIVIPSKIPVLKSKNTPLAKTQTIREIETSTTHSNQSNRCPVCKFINVNNNVGICYTCKNLDEQEKNK